MDRKLEHDMRIAREWIELEIKNIEDEKDSKYGTAKHIIDYTIADIAEKYSNGSANILIKEYRLDEMGWNLLPDIEKEKIEDKYQTFWR
jgi:hypothetical protein